MPTVLVVEDERDTRELLSRYLERAGIRVLTAATGAEAVQRLTAESPDLVVLDLGLPDVDGTALLRRVRGAEALPVVVLTARAALDDRLEGLQLGADDYITKPFSPREVVLRVQAVLHRARRGRSVDAGPVTYGGGRLRIDESGHEAWLDGRRLDLTRTEWDLLAGVAAFPERAFSRYELIDKVHGTAHVGDERTIDSHVRNLRHKLGASGAEVLVTVPGIGYRLSLHRDVAR